MPDHPFGHRPAAQFTVLSRPGCVQCMGTRRTLEKVGATFAEINLESDPDALAWAKNRGFQSAPVVVTSDGEVWAGYRPERIRAAASRLAA